MNVNNSVNRALHAAVRFCRISMEKNNDVTECSRNGPNAI